MRRANYSIRKESIEDQLSAGRFSPCLEIKFRDIEGVHVHTIGAGFDDELYVFREDGETLVVSHNPKLGYIGMESFRGDDTSGVVFFQGDEYETFIQDKNRSFPAMVRQMSELL